MMEFQMVAFLVIFLFQIYSVSLQNTCSPPNYPEGGSFFPKKLSYRFGDKVTYTCASNLTQFGTKENKCSQTKWLYPSPFCDKPAKLKYPSITLNKLDKQQIERAADLTDESTETCVRSIDNLKVYLDQPAPVHAVRFFLKRGSVNFEIKAERPPSKPFLCATFQRDIEADQWVTINCLDPNQTVEYLTVRDIHGNPKHLSICEIEAFTKDMSSWCPNPPRRTTENGHLEVSRGLAVLHCAEGYNVSSNDRLVCERGIWEGRELVCKEVLCVNSISQDPLFIGVWVEFEEKQLTPGSRRKLICPPGYHVEGKLFIATCLKSGNWTKTNATCVVDPPVKSSSSKTIGIAVGVVGAIVIIFFMGLTVYLLLKRGREVVVVYKPESEAAGQESEYSTIYYGTQASSFSPLTPPPRPLYLKPKEESEYTKPVDERTPVDIAFGTLKKSSLYDALND